MVFSQQNAFVGQGPTHGMGEDLRVVAALLRDVLPVLTRIQSRSSQSTASVQFGQMSPEAVAAVALVSDLAADNLRRLTAYLDANAEKHEGLESCAPLVANAARALAARDYSQCFNLLFDVYRNIAILRMDDPKMSFPGSGKDFSMNGRNARDAHSDVEGGETSPGQPH